MLKRFLKKIDQRFSIYTLCKVICVLLILFLLIKTQVVWGSWYRMLRSILQPFIIGFVLAYVMHPLVEFLEKKGIPKNFFHHCHMGVRTGVSNRDACYADAGTV